MAAATTLTRRPSLAEPQVTACRRPEDAVKLTSHLMLRDGTTVGTRAICADDAERLQAFHTRLSPATIYWRFFTIFPTLSPEMAEHLTHVDYENRMALVAITGDDNDERIVAVVRYERVEPIVAEIAVVVEDDWQRRGIATALLHQLAAYARRNGVAELVAVTLAENTRIHRLLRHCGFPARSSYADGLIELRLDIVQPPAFVSAT